jgi:heme A synthase
MRFFSKITVLFNACFLLYVVFWYIEKHQQYEDKAAQIMPLPWLKGSFVVLGYSAILVNVLFLLLIFIFYSFKANIKIPRWIIIFNIIIFCCQVYFHFILKD